MPEIIDLTNSDWNTFTRAGLPFEVRWNQPGKPRHHYRTREQAEAAIAEVMGPRPAVVERFVNDLSAEDMPW